MLVVIPIKPNPCSMTHHKRPFQSGSLWTGGGGGGPGGPLPPTGTGLCDACDVGHSNTNCSQPVLCDKDHGICERRMIAEG